MDDLISRQAAIDAVGSMLRRKFGIGGDLAEITLSGLPSAQPSTHPLDPCETCLHKGKGWDEEPCDGCTQNDNKYEPDNGWIPVSERLPGEKEIVLITFDERVEMGRMCGESWEWLFESGWDYWIDIDNVTAWMPLPDPYGGEQDG